MALYGDGQIMRFPIPPRIQRNCKAIGESDIELAISWRAKRSCNVLGGPEADIVCARMKLARKSLRGGASCAEGMWLATSFRSSGDFRTGTAVTGSPIAATGMGGGGWWYDGGRSRVGDGGGELRGSHGICNLGRRKRRLGQSRRM